MQSTSFCLRPTNPYCKAQAFKGLMFLQSFNSYCQSLRECISFEKVFLNEGRGSNKPKNTKVWFQIDFPALFLFQPRRFIIQTKIFQNKHFSNWIKFQFTNGQKMDWKHHSRKRWGWDVEKPLSRVVGFCLHNVLKQDIWPSAHTPKINKTLSFQFLWKKCDVLREMCSHLWWLYSFEMYVRTLLS